MVLNSEYHSILDWFWGARGFCGVVDNVLTPDILSQWERHECIKLQKWERDCIFGMDRAFRLAYNDITSWHMKRTQIKTASDKDKTKARRKNG